jgi:hypothetical protein
VPGVTDDWIVRLRVKLGIVAKVGPEISGSTPKPKRAEPDLPLATSSCPHPAGSFEKIEWMRQRAERGEAIFHPNDNRDIQYKGG